MTDGDAQKEAALLVAYANGDTAAAGELAQRVLPRVLGQAFRMLQDRSEAEDVAQEAMIRLWKIAPVWQQDKARVSTWLFRVVANLCTDRLRQRKRIAPLEKAPDQVDPASSVPEQLEARDRVRALSDALADLPDRQAQAVTLRHLEGFANPQIGEIMDISVEAVESLVSRGKRALSAKLAPRKEELGFEG